MLTDTAGSIMKSCWVHKNQTLLLSLPVSKGKQKASAEKFQSSSQKQMSIEWEQRGSATSERRIRRLLLQFSSDVRASAGVLKTKTDSELAEQFSALWERPQKQDLLWLYNSLRMPS